MKHLLIIITFQLFTFNLYAQSSEIGVLYQFKSSSGLVWKTFGQDKVSSGSKIAYLGRIFSPLIPILRFSIVSINDALGVISLPVPAVVGSAKSFVNFFPQIFKIWNLRKAKIFWKFCLEGIF